MRPLVEYTPKSKKGIRNKQTLNTETEKVIRMLIITLAIMIFVLTGAFLGMTNSTAQKGYTLQQIKLQHEELVNENNMIKAKLTSDASISSLQDEMGAAEMTEVEAKEYITSEDNIVN